MRIYHLILFLLVFSFMKDVGATHKIMHDDLYDKKNATQAQQERPSFNEHVGVDQSIKYNLRNRTFYSESDGDDTLEFNLDQWLEKKLGQKPENISLENLYKSFHDQYKKDVNEIDTPVESGIPPQTKTSPATLISPLINWFSRENKIEKNELLIPTESTIKEISKDEYHQCLCHEVAELCIEFDKKDQQNQHLTSNLINSEQINDQIYESISSYIDINLSTPQNAIEPVQELQDQIQSETKPHELTVSWISKNKKTIIDMIKRRDNLLKEYQKENLRLKENLELLIDKIKTNLTHDTKESSE